MLRLFAARNRAARKPQVGQLHRDAQPVVHAAVGLDEGLVGFAERIEPDQLGGVSGKGQQLLALRRR
jgi:hypothetical protein